MDLARKNVIITGAASGIGEALATACAKSKTNLLIADKNEPALCAVAKKIGCPFSVCDVSKEENLIELVQVAIDRFDHIDLFCSNAGVLFGDNGGVANLDNKYWEESWQVNFMSHVYTARHVLPHMIKRKSGYFLQIISAAALLSQLGASAYSATKSAALSFAESIAIGYGKVGIKVSAVCPQYVATPMIGFDRAKLLKKNINLLSADEAARRIIDGVNKEKFLILTDSKVLNFLTNKFEDYDGWIKAMQRLQERMIKQSGEINLQDMHSFI